jgi:hypothetical protein
MSDEIKLKDTIYNDEYYDSEEDTDDDNFENINDNDYDTCSEEDEEMGELLQELLNDVATVDILGKKAFRVDFNDTKNLQFIPKNEDCDFDYTEDDMPIMPDGGEEFLLPYMKEVSKHKKYFKGVILETNVKGKIFKL